MEQQYRTVTLTDRPPVRIREDAWPIAAQATYREAVKTLTAPERHRHRVCEARHAAAAWLTRRGDGAMVLSDSPAVRALCWLEAGGLYGGGLADPGAATTRHPAFRGLGKGRRLASDGGAWTAAIAAVGWGCRWGLDADGQLAVMVPRVEGSDGDFWYAIPVHELLPQDDESLAVAARRAIREAYPDQMGPGLVSGASAPA